MVEISSATAVWYSTGLFAVPLRWVLVRDPQGQFKTQALLCTDLKADPEKIVCWFVMRWQLEVTFQEVRRHLGFETQRQWSQMAIRRTTPALFGVVLAGHFVCAWPDGAGGNCGCLSSGGLVPQEPSDLRRRFGIGTKGAVGSGEDFSRVARRHRNGKSTAGVHGTLNRCGLLCSLMAKVELHALG